ncbi:hypothetical protein BDV97DRAFT_231230 [Delphinella strobiligena]|nr:hypothetical protein BDV97DRAFT_231230 [Delphinella strobiligena]
MAVELQRKSLAYDGHASLPVIFQSCRQGQEDMSALLNDLQKNISRRRGAVRVVLKGLEIRKHLDKIERAKPMLQIALSIYHGHLAQQRFGFVSTRIDQLEQQGFCSIATGFDRLESLVIASMSSMSIDAHRNKAGTSDQSRAMVIADKEEDAQSDTSMLGTSPSRPRKLARYTRIKFQPLPWLWTQTWDLAVQRACEGWDFSFKTYRMISWESPFFQACQVGDISAMQRMLSTRRALPSDRDEKGRTALHYLATAYHMHFQGGIISQTKPKNKVTKASSMLISAGADLYAVDNDNYLPFHYLFHVFCIVSAFLFDIDHSNEGAGKVDLVRTLTRSLDFDIADWETTCKLRFFFDAAPETIKLLQGKMFPP